METVKLVRTPLMGHFKFSALLSPKIEEEVRPTSKIVYSSAVGSLMFAMICTHRDISQAISLVSSYMTNPRKRSLESSPVDL